MCFSLKARKEQQLPEFSSEIEVNQIFSSEIVTLSPEILATVSWV